MKCLIDIFSFDLSNSGFRKVDYFITRGWTCSRFESSQRAIHQTEFLWAFNCQSSHSPFLLKWIGIMQEEHLANLTQELEKIEQYWGHFSLLHFLLTFCNCHTPFHFDLTLHGNRNWTQALQQEVPFPKWMLGFLPDHHCRKQCITSMNKNLMIHGSDFILFAVIGEAW